MWGYSQEVFFPGGDEYARQVHGGGGEQQLVIALGVEAAGAVLQLMFEKVGCSSIIAMHALPNTNSGRVMEKCGMHRKDCPPESVKTENGLFYCRVYELTRAEYERGFSRETGV